MTATQKPKPKNFGTTRIRDAALRRARLASEFVDETIADFISDATDVRSIPILKKHGVILPKESALPADK